MLTKRQKIIVAKFIAVGLVTAAAVFIMFNVKDFINRREGMLAMTQLGQYILEYKKNNNSLPPPTYIENIQKSIEGNVRLGKVQYRSMDITIDAPPDTILAYIPKKYNSLFFMTNGYIVLRLNGKVEWIEKNQFDALLASQQGPAKTESPQK